MAGIDHYDFIILGAGHNGLTAAAFLARAGKRVLVLERREVPGGTLVTEEFGGFQADMVQSGSLRPDIIRSLRIVHPAPIADPGFVSLLPEGGRLELSGSPEKAADSIRRFSEKDAQRWPDFVRFLGRAASFLEEAYAALIPALPRPPLTGALELAELALDLRLMGRKEMLEIIRALAMPVFELAEEYFESEPLRAAVASLGIYAVTLGPLSAGSSFNLIHNWMIRGGLAQRYSGRAGAVSGALVEALKRGGGEVRTGAEAASILVEAGVCKGVVLASGEQIAASAVIAAVDPRRAFLSLTGPMQLPPEFVWNVQSIKMRGSVAKVHLGLKALPAAMSPDTTYILAPSIRYLEQAYDAAKYGGISTRPFLEVTTGAEVLSIHFQYAPYLLKEGDWETKREYIESLAIDALAPHFPDLESLIAARRTLTPPDLESVYGLTEGDLNHGQIMLDQFFFMRPIPGYADHRTPIQGLYLGGSGVHGGGGVSGIAGRNAARAALRGRDHG